MRSICLMKMGQSPLLCRSCWGLAFALADARSSPASAADKALRHKQGVAFAKGFERPSPLSRCLHVMALKQWPLCMRVLRAQPLLWAELILFLHSAEALAETTATASTLSDLLQGLPD